MSDRTEKEARLSFAITNIMMIAEGALQESKVLHLARAQNVANAALNCDDLECKKMLNDLASVPLKSHDDCESQLVLVKGWVREISGLYQELL